LRIEDLCLSPPFSLRVSREDFSVDTFFFPSSFFSPPPLAKMECHVAEEGERGGTPLPSLPPPPLLLDVPTRSRTANISPPFFWQHIGAMLNRMSDKTDTFFRPLFPLFFFLFPLSSKLPLSPPFFCALRIEDKRIRKKKERRVLKFFFLDLLFSFFLSISI